MSLLSTWDALLLKVIETVVGIAVINAAVSKAGPLEDEVFKLDIRYICWMPARICVKSCSSDDMLLELDPGAQAKIAQVYCSTS